jgi:DHA2 family multidrug resistance protein-like MFS transporter
VGSLSAAVFRDKLGSALATAHAPHSVSDVATGSIAAADAAGRQVGGPRGAELLSAAHSAFVDSMAAGMRVAAAVALVAAIGAIFFLPRRGSVAAAPAPAATEVPVPAGTAAR